MLILADTSIWIDHFRGRNQTLAPLLIRNEITIHPCLIGELATGNLYRRTETLRLLRNLTPCKEASFGECLHVIESHHLHGLGLGWIDIQLLSAALLNSLPLWTRDQALSKAAQQLHLKFIP